MGVHTTYDIVLGFVLGMIFGPLSSGFVYLFITTIIFETYVMITTAMLAPDWQLEARVAITAAGVMGWILGRWLVLGETGVENLVGLPQEVMKISV